MVVWVCFIYKYMFNRRDIQYKSLAPCANVMWGNNNWQIAFWGRQGARKCVEYCVCVRFQCLCVNRPTIRCWSRDAMMMMSWRYNTFHTTHHTFFGSENLIYRHIFVVVEDNSIGGLDFFFIISTGKKQLIVYPITHLI